MLRSAPALLPHRAAPDWQGSAPPGAPTPWLRAAPATAAQSCPTRAARPGAGGPRRREAPFFGHPVDRGDNLLKPVMEAKAWTPQRRSPVIGHGTAHG